METSDDSHKVSLNIVFTVAASVILTVLLVGCASPEAIGRAQTDEQYFWKHPNPYPVEIGATAEVLNGDASNPKVERVFRCANIFNLFAAYIRPRFTSEQVGTVFRGAKWLEEVRVEPVRALAGWVPVFAGGDEEMFVMSLFPDQTGWSDWHIYFVISRSEGDTWEEGQRRGMAFLKGTLPDKKVRLREFALCYPQCKIERFTSGGVGLMVNDSGYRPSPDKR